MPRTRCIAGVMSEISPMTCIRPLGLVSGAAAAAMCADGDAMLLAGGPLAFTQGEVISRDASGNIQRSICPVPDLIDRYSETDYLTRLAEPRGVFGGLALSGAGGRPKIMGILNATPDSFSDGGDYTDPEKAIARGRAMHAAGADIIDVGGESTRPGADPVPVAVELDRVMPVVTALAGEGFPVSIDTRNAAVMRAAIDAGAQIVNDVSALAHDPDACSTLAGSDANVVLMHMQGVPETMQQAPQYGDVVLDVYDALAERVAACEAAGIERSRVCVDPGIGFGKTVAQNMVLISGLAIFQGLGCPVMIGVSRKSFVGSITGGSNPKDRLAGSLAAMLVALDQGAQIVRVHDAAETAQAVTLWQQAQAAV